MNSNGRQRLKNIRSMAAMGPVDAYVRWRQRLARERSMVAHDAPECLLEWYHRMTHDAAVAVRWSKPTRSIWLDWIDPSSDYNRMIRATAATCGVEMTPAELVSNRQSASETIRAAMEKKGTPMPLDGEAMNELLRALTDNGKSLRKAGGAPC